MLCKSCDIIWICNALFHASWKRTFYPLFKKDIFLYTVTSATTGLVQPPDKIVVRCAHTIYPYSLGVAPTILSSGIKNAECGKNQRQYPQEWPKPTRNKRYVAWQKNKKNEAYVARTDHHQVKPVPQTTVPPVPDHGYNDTKQGKEKQIPGSLENSPLYHAWVQRLT